MLRDELEERLRKEPVEPFRVHLVNGQFQDIFYPQNVAVQADLVQHFPMDQNWVLFPIDKIASIESLIADYHGKSPPPPLAEE